MTNRTVLVLLRASADQFNREMRSAQNAVGDLRREIDTTNDRTAWMVQGLLAIGPTLAPIGAAAVPILAGIATQATVGAAAIGTVALAFHGVGDALKALNHYQLDPTAANFAKLHDVMSKLGPDGVEFVTFLDQVGDKLSVLGRDARAGMFPGLQAGIDDMLTQLPKVRRIITEIAGGLGELASDAGEALAGGKFREFFNYMENEARPILQDMGRTAGNFIAGFADMIVAFNPVSESFSEGLLDMSRSFAEWAAGLDESQSFQDFLLYVERSGPIVMDLLGSIVNAFVQLTEASAPVGDILVPALTSIFNVIAALANTPVGSLLILGAALAGLAGRLAALKTTASGGALGSVTKGFQASSTAIRKSIPPLRDWTSALGGAARSEKQLQANMRTGSQTYYAASRRALEGRDAVKAYARESAAAAGSTALFALAVSGVSESMGITNTTMGGMVGLMATGGPWGFAIGAGIGALSDFAGAAEDTAAALADVDAVLAEGDASKTQDEIDKLEEHLDSLTSATETFQRTAGGVVGTLSGGLFGSTVTEELDGMQSEIDATRHAIGLLESSLSPDGNISAFETKKSRKALIDLTLGGLMPASKEARALAEALDDMIEGFTRLEGILGRQEAFDAYQAAIDNVRKGVKKLGDSYDATNDKGRQNRANIREFINSIETYATKLEEAGRIGDRNDFLKSARQQFLAFAKTIDIPRGMVNRLADEIWHVDQQDANPNVHVKGGKQAEDDLADVLSLAGVLDRQHPEVPVEVKPGNSLSILEQIRRAISLIKDKSVDITTVYRTEYEKAAGSPHLPRPPLADGGTLPGPRYPYGDKMLFWGAPGEEVITNRHGEADQFRSDRASGRIPRYADGGTIDIGSTHARTPDFAWRSLSELAASAARAGVAFDSATGSVDRERKSRKKLLEEEIAAVQDRISVLQEEKQAVKDSIAALIEGSAGLWDSIREAVIPAIGSTDEITWEDGDATFDSANNALNAQNNYAEELRALIKKLRHLGFNGPALAALLASGSIETIRDFANQTAAELDAYEQDYEYNQSLQNQIGNQASGAVGINAELRGLRQDNRELKHELKELNRHQKHAAHQRDEERKATEHVGGDVARAMNHVANRAMTGARRRG